MSERKVDVEIARKQYTNDVVLLTENDIIDVSVFDFSSQDSWLYIPPLGYQFECSIYDLYTWLEKEPEIILSANRKSIDTRTFTRPKKRSTRCFESILETLSSPVSNTWRTSNFPNLALNLNKYSNISIANKEEAIPSMLKTTSVANAFPEESATSGQESMEVFLNMSHSKGIDSFINSMEPGLSDPLMSVSQPSVLYSSIISFRDDSLCNIECGKGLDTSNATKMCNQEIDKHEVDMNETFTKGNKSDSENYCQNSQDTTIINSSGSSKDLNETFHADASMVVLSNSIENKSNTSNLSSTYIYKNEGNTRILESRDNEREETCNSNQKVQNLPALNITQCLMGIGKTNNGAGLTIKNDMQVNRDQTNELQKNIIRDVTKNTLESSIVSCVNSSVSTLTTNIFNSTLKFPLEIPQLTPVHFICGNSTYKLTNKNLESTPTYSTGLNSTFKAPTLLRKELLAEICKTGDHALNSTYNHAARSEKPKQEVINEVSSQIPNENEKPPMENRYNTYKKELPINKTKVCIELPSEAEDCAKNLTEKKYYTFTKKSSNHGGKTDMENAESSDNVDATFVKPRPKLPKRRQHIPRILSKMPQFLQKSNPNLVSSSLKTVDTTLSTNATNFGYMKGSQPNVRDVEKSLANKLYSLEKMRSGSEQRLNTGTGELHKLGAGGSTESIESTQSAHSAPDLDDRLSTCSDSSHNSYTTPQPTNIEQLQQIVKMQEESLKQDVTSRWNRRVSENAWVDTKNNLPSPISKNGIDYDRISLLNADYNFQTSSPLISPIKSSHSNTDGNTTRTIVKQQVDVKNETFSKPASKIENRTRLPQPTSWNRASNIMSAIPRPPSRIPGPRFVRPSAKSTQADTKRGCT